MKKNKGINYSRSVQEAFKCRTKIVDSSATCSGRVHRFNHRIGHKKNFLITFFVLELGDGSNDHEHDKLIVRSSQSWVTAVKELSDSRNSRR